MPHTADIRIEAWAATRAECIEEAVAALVASFSALSGTSAGSDWVHSVDLTPSDDEDLLVSVLDEVIFVLDTRSAVPVEGEVEQRASGSYALHLYLTDVAAMELVGAVPKAVTLSDLRFERTDDRWSCAVTIDV